MKNKGKAVIRSGAGGSDQIGIRIPGEMRVDLEAIAHREARTLSNVIRIALSKFIVEDQARRKLAHKRAG